MLTNTWKHFGLMLLLGILAWVLVPEGVRPLYNWTYENGEFIPPQIEEESDETE